MRIILLHRKSIATATQLLVLVVLLNVSGHFFFHLGDPVLAISSPHFAASHESDDGVSYPPDKCAVCQDAQNLVIDIASVTIAVTGHPVLSSNRLADLFHHGHAALATSPRAPPII